MRNAVTSSRYVPIDEAMCRLIDQVAVECGIDFVNAVDYMLSKGIGYWAFDEGNEMLQRPLLRYNNKHLTDDEYARLLPEWA